EGVHALVGHDQLERVVAALAARAGGGVHRQQGDRALVPRQTARPGSGRCPLVASPAGACPFGAAPPPARVAARAAGAGAACRALSTALAKRETLAAMTHQHRIGFVGAGNMATALLRGLLRAGGVTPAQVRITDVDAAKAESLA